MPLISGGAVAELAISASDAGAIPTVASGATQGDLVAVEIDFFDVTAGLKKTLRLCNIGPLLGTVGGFRVQYEPALIVPIKIGAAIEADQYGSPMRGVASRGQIEFAVPDAVLPYLSYGANGRPFRIYLGERTLVTNTADEIVDFGDPHAGLALVYAGLVEDISYDAIARRAAVAVTDARVGLDGPLVLDLYDDTAPEGLRGQPKPELFGTAYSLEPVIEDDANKIFRLSRGDLDSIQEVRVGGIMWDQAAGAPGPGQWARDGGRIVFGGTTLDGEVRADARSAGWDSYTPAALVAAIVLGTDSPVDAAGLVALGAAVPDLAGYYAIIPVNRQDALDDIMTGIGGWWGATPDGRIAAGLIAAPAGPPLATYTEIEIATLQLVKRIPPAWRIRVEYRRNWQPAGQFYSSVTEAEQAAMKSGGIVAAAWQNDSIKAAEPRAVDVPLIRSVVIAEAAALAIRDRLAAAWGVARRVWKVEIRDEPPAFMSTVAFDFEGIAGLCRVISVVRSFGGGPNEVVLWG